MQEPKKPYNIISEYRLLCSSHKFSLYVRGNKVFSSHENKKDCSKLGVIPIGYKRNFFAKSKLITRLMRLEPRCGLFLNENEAIISGFGKVYYIDVNNQIIHEEHSFRKGMNNPLSFSRIEGVHGFTDGILYGDYINSRADAEISIYRRDLHGKWDIVFTFKKGRVKHIHSIIPSVADGCLYILTGDSDEESGIWKVKDDFNSVELILGGKQRYRACFALPIKNGLVFATDSPDEENALWFYDFLRQGEVLLQTVAGPCIYGTIRRGELFFSTSVEPDSTVSGFRSWVTYKRGSGVKDTRSHIYRVDSELKVKEILSIEKDFLPMRAFGYGTFLFPDCTNGELNVTGQGLRECAGKTLHINL